METYRDWAHDRGVTWVALSPGEIGMGRKLEPRTSLIQGVGSNLVSKPPNSQFQNVSEGDVHPGLTTAKIHYDPQTLIFFFADAEGTVMFDGDTPHWVGAYEVGVVTGEMYHAMTGGAKGLHTGFRTLVIAQVFPGQSEVLERRAALAAMRDSSLDL